MRLKLFVWAITACLTSISLYGFAQAEGHPKSAAPAAAKFINFPGLPTCLTGAVQNGDPMKGAFVVLAKTKPNCAVPWHWHSASEQLMFVNGSARVQMKDDAPKAMSPGSYVNMPSKHPHEFRSTTAATFFIVSDGAFDIHYVGASGNEIPADQALKSGAKTKNSSGAAKKK